MVMRMTRVMKRKKKVKKVKVKRQVKKLIMERKKVKLMTGKKKSQRLTMLQFKIVSSFKEMEEINFERTTPRSKSMRL